MWQPASDHVVASLILGTCTLVAALIKAWVFYRTAGPKAEKKKRRWGLLKPKHMPRLAFLAGAAAIAVVLAFAPGDESGETGAIEHASQELLGRTGGAFRAASSLFQGESSEAGAVGSNSLNEWIETEGLSIFYNYAEFLPGACTEGASAAGNWTPSAPVPVECVNEAWLSFDTEPLLASGRIVRNVTYCVNFTDGAGGWGRQATAPAPGFDAIAVPARRVPLGEAIGFRIVSRGRYDHVVLSNAYPRVSC